MEINNKVVIITWASSWIWEATARLLHSKWAKVVLVARSKDKILKLQNELSDSFAITADMTDENHIKHMIKKTYDHFWKIDILINNAWQWYNSSLEDINIDKFKYIFDLNIIWPVIAMQQVIPIMRKQWSWMIINISSGTSVMYIPNVWAYSSTKRALNWISLTARAELEKDNIKVSIIHPYVTETEFFRSAIKNPENSNWQFQARNNMPAADSPEFVAEKILETIESEEAEVFVHDWMKNRM